MATWLAWLTGLLGLSLPAANPLPAAALREAPPNSDDSNGNELMTQLMRAAETEYD